MSQSVKVVIVGGGVSGFSCGVNILESLANVEVTIVAELLSPNTIGDKAAGLCFPFAMKGTTPTEEITKWFKTTFKFCNDLAKTGEAATAGIFPMTGFVLGYDGCSLFKDVFLTYQVLNETQMKRLLPSSNSEGTFLTTYVMEGKTFLSWLRKKFIKYGGKIEVRKVKSLSELSQYDIIINCTGLGAQELVCDNEVYPVRGQVIKVKAPFIKQFLIDLTGETTYIIPTLDIVTVGGTIEKGNYDINVNFATKKRMMKDACQLVPNLKNCEFVEDWAGLRPGRTSVRVEKEIMQFNGKTIPVIHNYGHGGSGLTFSWGCAEDVVALLKQNGCVNKFSSNL